MQPAEPDPYAGMAQAELVSALCERDRLTQEQDAQLNEFKKSQKHTRRNELRCRRKVQRVEEKLVDHHRVEILRSQYYPRMPG